MKQINESAAIYQSYFLTALGYTKYSPRKNMMEKKKRDIVEDANGAILHHYYHLQAYPYPSAGDYDNVKLHDGIHKFFTYEEIYARARKEREKQKRKEPVAAKKNKYMTIRELKSYGKKSKDMGEGLKRIRSGKSAFEVVEDLL